MRLMITIASVLLALQVASQRPENEIAPYTLIRQDNGYEERQYPEQRWICHEIVQRLARPDIYSKSFLALFAYLNGANSEGKRIPMTAPVTMEVQRVTEALQRYQMCFYLPSSFQPPSPSSSPPVPTTRGSYVITRPSMVVLTRQFGGRPETPSEWQGEAKALRAVLEGAGEKGVDFTSFIGAVYNRPTQVKDRRNEVWFVKKNE
ncbi:heme-binding protein 2-like [Penaeus japonicus]|uniref:heme-binding protein 2-like n=1 Tax=Penaeus japonicus TaxID=27405 RepID=UPI001C7170B6|nr:heme-binding protein 2-like [Penaeus japonicus]XP_042867243.1 heme-binding protein 2-like [Penaeus japonicus]